MLSKTWWNLSNSYNYRTFLLEFFMDGCVEIRSMSENSLELVFYYHCVCNCKYEREVFNASEVYLCHFFFKEFIFVDLLLRYVHVWLCYFLPQSIIKLVCLLSFIALQRPVFQMNWSFFSIVSLKKIYFSNSVFQKDFFIQGKNWKR